MNGKKVTLRELAKETGLSVNSVSLALRGIRTSEQTQRRVREAADRLGYVGNAQASSIRTGSTRNVAVIVGDLANPHTARVLKECVKTLGAQQYNVLIYNSGEDEAMEKGSIRSALRQNVDGVLISPVKKDGSNIGLLADSGIPTVVFGSRCRHPNIASVCLDDEQGGFLAASHLIAKGYRSVLFVNGPEQVQGARERLQGYKRALMHHGLAFDKTNVITADLKDDQTWQTALTARLNGLSESTAVLAYSDMLALLIYSFCTDNGLSIGAIAGFDNALHMLPCALRFPSVAEQDEQIASAAPQMLLQRMQHPEEPAQSVVLKVSLYNVR